MEAAARRRQVQVLLDKRRTSSQSVSFENPRMRRSWGSVVCGRYFLIVRSEAGFPTADCGRHSKA